ncbi:putative sensor histidine kinase/response regulator [Aspergillus clavatus NRRL 1]|uniref:histidine kinase n=1 Tax=Aspergillus clavatus (strain ATCC 1007 / CBS 513.65 / DSM 816 / NCTC 3887 / NRRL 1 / QM 1276 / 107) TaxID=344612 RepID=A1CKZ7_ASPCL|nr:sensor histidine kinase/response regulator, putative [Aspergillus clavatus NRRL 1]EAW09821.1 sensor histidine kinase/response regulator, putative [Aspergillus clavatus NRRL 1]
MGEVQGMSTSPLPSPAEVPSPIPPTAANPYNRASSRPASNLARASDERYPLEKKIATSDHARKTHSHISQVSHGSSANARQMPSSTLGANVHPDEGCLEEGRSSQTLKELRRQMEELLVYQQMQQAQDHNPSNHRETNTGSSVLHDSARKRRISNLSPPKFALSATGTLHSDSTGSAGTVKALDLEDDISKAIDQTPSYPFPKMNLQQIAKPIQDATSHSGQFKLTLPSEKLKIHMAPTQSKDDRQPAINKYVSGGAFLPLDHKLVPDDASYPTPNLYDLTLQLNADSGLEAWWANVVEILKTHYGAERVSLAVPGDTTDLENVPWGQKAVWSPDANPVAGHNETITPVYPTHKDAGVAGKLKKEEVAKEKAGDGPVPPLLPKRPTLLSRHSFAGFGKERTATSWHDMSRAQHIQKMREGSNMHRHEMPSVSELGTPGVASIPEQETPTARIQESCDPSNPSQCNDQNTVFPLPRPLEVEPDPLIKRTGVVKLFGRTKPVVLTREYSQNPVVTPRSAHGEVAQTPEDTVQVTPTTEPSQTPQQIPQYNHNARPRSASNLSTASSCSQRFPLMHVYDEYEQVPPSPWSQSPAPSPAPRAHADQNPFFTIHTVDESAFAQHPPPHDYSNTEPLEAIGVDLAKSVVHIPLLHAGRSKETSPSTLRFPVAVISILSPIIPYPSSLRQSLAFFMPHLTTSFNLAQQYSQLERQLSSRVDIPRFGHILGLGGTFSDESSEMELVAGLSGHISYHFADDVSLSARASLSSPGERSNSTKFSPAISGFGTPGIDLGYSTAGAALNPGESPGPSAKSGNEAVDSYFNVQRSKSVRDALTHHRNKLSKPKKTAASTPTSPGRVWEKRSVGEESSVQDPTVAELSPLQESKVAPVISPTQHTSRHASATAFYAQLQRELPRPFSDTIAQLMLNSVPLHLFLAKPQSGEVIWTNSKFDAYRRSQPQEQKLRDPWQNIHPSEREHVSQEWANALRTGSQFTERVRVKRFNDDAAYRWFIFRANPLLSSTGEVLYWIGSFLDIHEQHIAELKAVQERQKFAIDAKYRAFSNSIPQVVFEATEHRGLIFVNEQWHLYTGQKLEDALNFGFAKHIHPDDLEKCSSLSSYLSEAPRKPSAESNGAAEDAGKEKVSSPGRHFPHGVTPALDELVRLGIASVQKDENGRVFYSTEIRLRSKGGDYRWHLVRLVRVETSSFGSGEASWYGTCTDINDRKNLERELNRAMQQLNHQMESKTKFFSNMSHEIRTPLNGILGTIPFILDTQLDTDQRRMLDTIQNSSTNLRELVDNILDVSRVEAGKMSLVNSWFHVRSVIEDVIDTVSSRALDKGLELNYLMDVDVPPMVIGDRFRIRQVLINLVGNAVKFTAQGEVYIRCSMYCDVSVPLKETELMLNFDVVDTGKGFSARDSERLMQRFSQLGENASQQNAGSGLGLFLSKQLVEMHGGRLTPSSKEGQGAKFSFFVKVDAPPPPSAEDPRLVRQSSSTSEAFGAQPKPDSLQRLLFYSRDSADPKVLEPADLSPALESPLSQPPSGFESFARFPFTNFLDRSSVSSALPTPEVLGMSPSAGADAIKLSPQMDATQSRAHPATGPSNDALLPPQQPPSMSVQVSPAGTLGVQNRSPFSILILCPLDHARKAIKQHIEQVVPHDIPFSISSLPDVEDWRDSINDGSASQPTHLVLNLPNVDDIKEMMQYVSGCDPATAPALVIISDLYQKRQINSKIMDLSSSGRRVFTVPKPVKPSAFSTIFDPSNQRDLSKDRNQDMAREINNNFKTMSKIVKEVIGNKGYRILLVEDDETNRMVMMKYLDKIKVMAETAANGQECTEMVFSKEPGYYSLIICDIQMPVKNGYETCREIRTWELKNHYPQIPIMALSANAMTDQIENAARAGFNDYVTKPIKHNDLGKMMMGLLSPDRPLLLLRDRLQTDSEGHLSAASVVP